MSRAHLAFALVAALYAVFGLTRPVDVFWSPDQGGKLLQVLALLDGRFDLSIDYPGRSVDPGLAFRPYLHSYVVDGRIQVPWSIAWALPAALGYALLGGPGLTLLPVLGGLLAAWASGRLAERVAPGSGWLAILICGLASPLFVFSSLFWEHAPAVGLFMLGIVLVGPAAQSRSRASLLLAGCCFGLAIAWRNELSIFVMAAGLCASRIAPLRFHSLGWLFAGLLILVPIGIYNWLVTGVLLAHSDALPGSVRDVADNLARNGPTVIDDLLVGRGAGLELPELLRWAPAMGLVLLAPGRAARGPIGTALRTAGLTVAAAPAVGLLVIPAPQAVHGLLIAAPFMSLLLLTPARPPTPTGRFLLSFVGLAVLLYALAGIAFHAEGLAGGGTEWGPRFALPIFPPAAALAAVTLADRARRERSVERFAGAALVLLGAGFQLIGMARIDLTVQQFRQNTAMIASLPPGPVVIRPSFLVSVAPVAGQGRPIYCVGSAAGLREWVELARGAGAAEFWYVDRAQLPAAWIPADARALAPIEAVRSGFLWAARYRADAVAAALRPDGPPPAPCGTSPVVSSGEVRSGRDIESPGADPPSVPGYNSATEPVRGGGL